MERGVCGLFMFGRRATMTARTRRQEGQKDYHNGEEIAWERRRDQQI